MTVLRTCLAMVATVCGLLVAVPVLVLTGPFLLVSFLTRRLASRLEPQVVSWQQVIEFYPTIGWKPKSHLNTYALADDVFHVTTDADGWRGKNTIPHSDVIVFGDSHAFGHGIDDRQYFASLTPTVRVKAIGANGYNMVQELLWMQHFAPQLREKLVVWFVFLGNDLLDNLEPSMRHYRTPFVRTHNGTQQWEIVTHHVNAEPWPFVSLRYRQTNYDRLIKIFSDTFVSQRAVSACGFLLAQAAELCNHAGAQLVVLTIPDPVLLSQRGLELLYASGAAPQSLDPDLPDKKLRAICDTLGIPFVAGTSFLSVGEYKEYDDHWNERGHRRVAETLQSLYRTYTLRDQKTVVEAVVFPALEGRQRA